MSNKRNAIAKKSTNEETGVITFTFADARTIVFDPAAAPDNVKSFLLSHGASQKIGDTYAGAESVDEAYEDAREMADSLMSGILAAKRAAGEPRIGRLLEALARVTGKDIALCKALFDQMSDEMKKKVRADAGIKKAMAAIDMERADTEIAKGGVSILDNLF